MSDPVKKTKKTIGDLAAGALAGVAASSIVAPIDTISDNMRSAQKSYSDASHALRDKSTLTAEQIAGLERDLAHQGKLKNSFIETAKHLWNTPQVDALGKEIVGSKARLRPFYAGLGSKLIKVAPAMAIQFALYEVLKDAFSKTAAVNKTRQDIKKLEYHIDALRMSKYLTADPYVKEKLDAKIHQLTEEFAALNRMNSLVHTPQL